MPEGWRERAAEWRARTRATRDRAERDAYALSLAVRHERTPWYVKGLLVSILAYAISPIDPLPDVLPVVGLLDELLLLPLGVGLAARLLPEGVLAECRARADEVDPGRERWVAAAVVLVSWALVALAAWHLLAPHV